MKNRTSMSALAFAASVSLLCALGAPDRALAQAQTKNQQKCINAVNKAMNGLAKAELKVLSGCSKNSPGGGAAAVFNCYVNDVNHVRAKARDKVASAATKACLPGELPDFAFTDTDHVSEVVSANTAFNEIVSIYGNGIGAARGTPEGDCVAASVKALHKYTNTQLKDFATCKRSLLKDGVTDASALVQCMSALPSDQAHIDAVVEHCPGVSLSTVFAADCAGAPDVVSCVNEVTKCAICRTVGSADDVPVDCDMVDDATSNMSCARNDYVAGDYSGAFTTDGSLALEGTLDASFSQANGTLTGGVTIAVAPADEGAFIFCYGSNPVSGTVSSGTIAGTTINADVTLSNVAATSIDFTGNASGDTLGGSFSQVGTCFGFSITGTWSLTRLP